MLSSPGPHVVSKYHQYIVDVQRVRCRVWLVCCGLHHIQQYFSYIVTGQLADFISDNVTWTENQILCPTMGECSKLMFLSKF